MMCICVLVVLATQDASPTPKANPRLRKNQDMDGNAEVLHYGVYQHTSFATFNRMSKPGNAHYV